MTDVGKPDDGPIFTMPLVMLMVSNASLRTSTFMLMTLVPVYVLDRGFSPTEAGLTTTLYMGAAVLMRPWSGSLVDQRGRWAVMTIGALIFTLTSGLYLLSLPIWLFLILRAVQGLGFSLNGTGATTLATDLIPERRLAQGLGLIGLEQTVVQMFAPWLALELRASAGYTTAFFVVFGFCVLNLLLRIPLAKKALRLDRERGEMHAQRERERVESGAQKPQARLWHRIVEKNAWRASSVMFFVMFGTTSVGSFLAAYTISRGIENAGIFFAASGAAVAVSRIVLVPLGRRVGQIFTVIPGILAVSLSMLVILWTPSLWQLASAGILYGLGMGVVIPGLNTVAVLSASRRLRGKANATFYMAMDLGQAVGAWVLGVLATAFGLGSAFVASSIMICIAGAILLTQWKMKWVVDPA